jgi:uncharacterized protein involved in exopolysaccharide biosynthesis
MPMTNSTSEIEQDRDLSLREAGRIIYAGRRWVLACMLVTTLACSLWAWLSATFYRSSVVLIAVTLDRAAGGGMSSALGQFGGLASLAGINLEPRDSRLEEALAVLQSREFIERFISDHNLLPAFFPKKWDAHTESWNVPERKQPTPWKGYKYFSKEILNVTRDKKTELITVTVDWKDRAVAADWANEIVERVNAEMRERVLQAAVLSIQYLEKEREQTQLVETREAINRLIESEIRQKMLATVTKEYVFRVVDRALPADIDDIERPKRLLLVLLGVVGGALLGSIGVLMGSDRRGSLDQTS